MGFKANNLKGTPSNGVSNISKNNKNVKNIKDTKNVELTREELELILITIKNSLFKGENVEVLYNLILKIQEAYLTTNKK